jgi:tetratricopeptide (TPR) repeat protein
MMRLRALSLSFLLAGIGGQALLFAQQSTRPSEVEQRAALHRSVDWELVSPHLPDPATASAAALELAADVLRARRFPEDALDYYQYAQARGGDPLTLMKKIGVTRLELQQNTLARAIFLRCTQMAKKDPQAWNNLGAADYTLAAYRSAINEYSRAVKLNRKSAVFHANLGMAYLSVNEPESARTQFQTAMRLDPKILEGVASGGVTLHVLEIKDYAKLCFEMARVSAMQGQMGLAKVWLQRAGERGLDLRSAVADDSVLRPLLKDPGFQLLLSNTETMRKHVAVANAPSLGTSKDSTTVPE